MAARRWEMVILNEAIQRKLAKLPGHGMSSQVCDLTLRNQRVLKQILVKGHRFFYTGKNLKTADIVDAELSF
jgi:intracellular sulfur oxidation DsrE/DsrF family protein